MDVLHMRRLINCKRFKTKIGNLTCIVISLSVLIIGFSGCGQQVVSSTGEKASLQSEQAVSSDKVSSEQVDETPSISSISEQKEDTVSKHAVFKVTELTEQDFQSVQLTVQAQKKLPFDGHSIKKTAIIDGNFIIADDSSATNVILYQFNKDTLMQEKTLNVPYECTVGFSNQYVVLATKTQVEYYNGKLELKKTAKIKADSSYRKNDTTYWSATVIDENHIAWFAHDRSVSVTGVEDGNEMNFKKVEDNLSVLFESINKTGRPNQILVSGSAYKDIKGASGSDNDIIAIGDITQGAVIDYIYKKELDHSCISTKSGLVYKLPMEVTIDRTHLAINGFIHNFDKFYDLDNRKVYHFVDKSSINANNFIASYNDNINFYFIMFSLEDGKEINYLIKV